MLIGNNIRVTIVQIKGGQVRVGIEAPREVLVLREELNEKAQDGGEARDDRKRQT